MSDEYILPAFTSGDFYVLKSAIDQTLRTQDRFIAVRTDTLKVLGADALIGSSDAASYALYLDRDKPMHTSQVDCRELHAFMQNVTCPIDPVDE